MMKLNAHAGPHWNLQDWHQDVVDPAQVRNAGPAQGVATMSGLDANTVHEWLPGTALPDLSDAHHLPTWSTRLQQRLIHPLLLPLLDARRPRFNEAFQPTFIEPE